MDTFNLWRQEDKKMRFLLPAVVFVAFFGIFTVVLCQDDFPYSGVVTGDRVNLRAGAGMSHKVLLKLKKETKVTVVGKKQVAGEEWLEVEMPSDVFLYISQRFVEKKEEKGNVIGVVKTEQPDGTVAVRTGIEADDVVAGYVKNGDTVQIRGTKDGWYNIVPPKGFTAWLNADYVKKLSGGDVKPPAEEDSIQKRLEEIEKQLAPLLEEQKRLKKILEEREEKEREAEKKRKEFEEIVRKHQENLAKIEERARELQERLKGGEGTPIKRYVAQGIVDDFGKLKDPPPVPYRLRISEDGEVKYYLQSVDPSIDLSRYLRKRVGVNGEIEKLKWGDKEIEVIKVESIAILEK